MMSNTRIRFQIIGLVLLLLGLLAAVVASFGPGSSDPLVFFLSFTILLFSGSFIYIISKYYSLPGGIKNDHNWSDSLTARGIGGWILATIITGFYVLLYWHDTIHALDHLIRMLDPFSNYVRAKPADQWFLYGFLYTDAIIIMGVKMILKYRHSNYQIIRTSSIIFFQLGLAFLLPALLQLFHQPEFYFSYFWPLKHEFLFPSNIHYLLEQERGLSTFMVFWGTAITFIGVPVLTYYFGKRWYCSWVCGCGGLANTAGDPFRHLSDKSISAWKIERCTIYSILVIITIITGLLWVNSLTEGAVFGDLSFALAKWYGLFIGMVFSGVIGVGFYPIMGSRVWCRFGCPMAGMLGIFQRYFSRFRITTNGSQCISCGNCSTYCEMGINVRWYAQRGQNIVRASCVGCGICSSVCPRGVLNLENGSPKDRIDEHPELIG